MLSRPRDAGRDWPSPQAQQRWKDQTVLLQHVHLEHVVWLHEIFVGPPPHRRGQADASDRAAYVAMEWVEGPTISQLCDGRPASAATVTSRLHYVADVASALHEMHAATREAGNPSLHRDLKPGNCIVHPARGVVLIDVSGMRGLDDDFDPAGLHTPSYTAPEVLRHPHGRRELSSDLYALGALAVFCLTGEDPPPAGAAAADRLAPVLRRVAREAGVSRSDAFVAHLLAMLRADPATRPTDGQAWAAELRRLGESSDGDGPSRRPRRRTAGVTLGALALAGAVGAGAALAFPDSPAQPGSGPTAAASLGATATVTPLPSASTAVKPPVVTSAAAPPQPTGTFSATPTAAVTANPPPAPTTKAPRVTTAAPTTRAAVVTTTGSISSPSDGADVKDCAYFSGSSRLASGRTLILAMRNLDNGDPDRYVEMVFGWDKPAQLGSWRGAQYFGGAPGQRYRVELMSVDLDAARAAGRDTAATNALAARGSRLASRDVVKQEGTVGNDCVGP